ncbi:MAG: ABC transporter permease [Oscillospiraceae bacterium]|nr:ABC transporter permease [Oscillospiraceae bacterium]MBO7727580.1 ABC transporter permease [Oscillospiraceae bacterium]
MKNTLRQVFHSSKFLVGFIIFLLILLTMWVYPFLNPGNPLEMIGVGTFARPGTYFSLYDAVNTPAETLRLSDADDKRVAASMSMEDRVAMVEWFTLAEVDIEGLDINDTDALLDLWFANYDSSLKLKGMTNAKKNYYKRLDRSIREIRAADTFTLMHPDEDSGELVKRSDISKTDYINVGQVTNVKRLPLGTDNFGRDVLKELVSATGTSIVIGLIAGIVATFIGLSLGLLAGYVGGFLDDIIMFITNIFTVIPSFVLLILISYSIGQDQRGASVVAIVIGFTSWTWTARSVRSQVISLRNRDHVNLSKLSGHSLVRIILTDILPYIASYVVMAFILQVSSGILSEAQLSLLGLGPKTTEVPTLGLMMNWAMLYSAHTNGSWWAYFPVILTITFISFSLNLMNTGLDQVFNPTLRD